MGKILDINKENIDESELFCKKTKKKLAGYQNKVKWVKERFDEGLKYKILIVTDNNKETSRGMIEYIPGEYNWRGINADGWMVIHCVWVVGKFKKKGYGSKLVELAIKDAKEAGLKGVVGMTADKGGWMPKKSLYEKILGFEKVDEMEPYFQLYAKAFDEKAPKPKFHPISEEKKKQYEKGVTIMYSDQCPYVVDLVDELREDPVGDKVNLIKLDNCKDAQKNGVYPYGTYCAICNGEISLYQHTLKKQIQAVLNKESLL